MPNLSMKDNKALKAELVKKYPTEQVFVVPYAQTKKIPDKFTLAQNIKMSIRDWEAKGSFVLRHDAEYNSALQQLIPYILVVNSRNTDVFVTKRIAGDSRLAGSYALGCGGHINPVDAGDVITNAAIREMNEELDIKISGSSSLSFVGYVRDLASETNDHLGLVFIIRADEVAVKETENLEGVWMDFGDLVAKHGRFESWARHIIDYMYMTHSMDKIFI